MTLSQEGICSSEQKVEAGTEPVSLQEAWSHPQCKAAPFQTLLKIRSIPSLGPAVTAA